MKIIKTFPPDLVEARIHNLALLRALRQHQAYVGRWRLTTSKPSHVGRNHIPVSEIALPDTAHAVRMGHKIRWRPNPYT